MFTAPGSSNLDGVALEAWRGYLRSHAAILRELDAELDTEHGLTTRDYEVMLYLSQADDRRLPMSAVAERTRLTRSGITRLIDGLVRSGFVERDACTTDARVSYAHLTEAGHEKLRQAGCTHLASVQRLFVSHFSDDELRQLASLLGRLPGSALGPCSVDDPAGADAGAAAGAGAGAGAGAAAA